MQNFPTVGLIDGVFRANLEETGMGYDLEVDMIRRAAERGLLTAPYVFDAASAQAMARAGADVLVPHMGLTTKGTIGARTARTLEQCVALIQEMRDAAVAINPDVIVLCHGGPIAEPEDAALRARAHRRRGRLLRRLEHGASAHRGRDDGEHAALQGAGRQLTTLTSRRRAMPSKLVDPHAISTLSFDWGVIKPLVARANTDDPAMSLMHVVLLPGRGHERHNHPESDEILYIVAGEGEQMVDDGEPFPVRPEQAVFIPKGAYHSTLNTGWQPLSLLAIYSPAGAEDALAGLPDFRELAAGEVPELARV